MLIMNKSDRRTWRENQIHRQRRRLWYQRFALIGVGLVIGFLLGARLTGWW